MSADTRREAHLRRVAARQGLQMHKCRARDPRAIGYGTYQLADPVIGLLYSADGHNGGFGLDLDEVAEQLGEVQ